MPSFITVGKIVSTFGLKGQVKVESLTDFPERMAKGTRLRLNDEWVEVEKATFGPKQVLLKLSGVDSVEAAAALKWKTLEAVDEGRPELEDDEFLVSDLLGMLVVTSDGQQVGGVDEVLPYPAQDVLRVGEVMIPLVKQFVKSVDVVGRVITVELIPGMLPEDE